MIHIEDHPFPPWVEREIESQVLGYPLEYAHRAIDQGPQFFGRTLWDQGQPKLTDLPWTVRMICSWVCQDLALRMGYAGADLWRVQFNGQLGGQSPGEHWDYSEQDRYTVLYYCLGRSGDTVFRDDQGQERDRAQFRQHRVVAFPSRLWHEALAPDPGDWRVSLAMVITVK